MYFTFSFSYFFKINLERAKYVGKVRLCKKTSKFSYCSLVKCLLNEYKPHGVPFQYPEKKFRSFGTFLLAIALFHSCFALVFSFFVRFTAFRRKICTLAVIFVELSFDKQFSCCKWYRTRRKMLRM